MGGLWRRHVFVAGEGSPGSGGSGATTSSQIGGGGDGPVAGEGQGAEGGSGGVPDPGPNVDTSDPQLYETTFKPEEADPAAALVLGTQPAYLDTRVEPRGLLVVYLHGAGTPTTCGSSEHSKVLAGFGFHVVDPCYSSAYGVGICGDDIEGCRLEAFEGVDHHPFIAIDRANSIEGRVTKMLEHLATAEPAGDWRFFLEGTGGAPEDVRPRWERIVISGISHGASTSGVIGLHRSVARVVMLSGPLDSSQAWLASTSTLTPRDRFYGFTHEDDGQHTGHLAAFTTLSLEGAPVDVDVTAPPYAGSHRLVTNAETTDGHYRASFATLPGVELKRIDDSAHFIFIDQPEVFYSELDAFLAR